jgi:hypothetical protein
MQVSIHTPRCPNEIPMRLGDRWALERQETLILVLAQLVEARNQSIETIKLWQILLNETYSRAAQ